MESMARGIAKTFGMELSWGSPDAQQRNLWLGTPHRNWKPVA